jgi:serine/threonine protein phosphatase 1
MKRSLWSQWFGNAPEYEIPEGMRVYAVGDIHGCLRQLDQLLEMIAKDAQGAPAKCLAVFLGDYVDRGPDSKGVIDRLLSHPLPQFEVHYIRGNHEQSLLDFLADPNIYRFWKGYGAQETLMSYGVIPPRFDHDDALLETQRRLEVALPKEHLAFLQELPLSFSIGGYFFAHAGARPGLALGEQVAKDLMWVREEFIESDYDFGKMVVHGHTPTDAPVVRANRIGIDTGTYATGRLTSLVLEGTDRRFLQT